MGLNLDNANEIGGNDPQFLKELLLVYEKRFPEYYDTLEQAIAKQDLRDTADRLHRVKSAASVLGFKAFCAELKEAEDYCLNPEAKKEKALARSSDLLVKFKTTLQEVQEYLQQNFGK